jgi:hypothetical protein
VTTNLPCALTVNVRLRAAASVVALVLTVMLAGCERYSLDRQMEELCKKDGGVTVYEKVSLPAHHWDWANRVTLGMPSLDLAADENRDMRSQDIADGQYQLITDRLTLKDGDPMKGQGVLARTEQRVVRTKDNKVLGVAVSYGRVGGDFIVIGHWSSATCPMPAPRVLALFTREN